MPLEFHGCTNTHTYRERGRERGREGGREREGEGEREGGEIERERERERERGGYIGVAFSGRGKLCGRELFREL